MKDKLSGAAVASLVPLLVESSCEDMENAPTRCARRGRQEATKVERRSPKRDLDNIPTIVAPRPVTMSTSGPRRERALTC